MDILDFFRFFLKIFYDFLDFLNCVDFLRFSGSFRIFFRDFWTLFKVTIRLLINVPEVTTEHQKWLEISTNSVKSITLLILL